MAYYMRFFCVEPEPPTLADLREAAPDLRESGELWSEGQLAGALEIARPGQDLFDEDIEEFQELLEESEEGRAVANRLRGVTAIYALAFVFGEREPESVLSAADPIWDRLFDSGTGLLQADGEGFYAADGELLAEVG